MELIAQEKQCTPAQLALAWLLAQGNDIVPIPGTKKRRYLEENLEAINLHLTEKDVSRLNAALPAGSAAGLRYPERSMGSVNK